MNHKASIILTGVGGQGVITAAYILGKSSVNAGVNVYASQAYGIAQRGGSIFCTVRMGNVLSPLVANGTADVILSTEPIEPLRYIQYANNETKIITDIQQIVPFSVTIGQDEYPRFKEIKSHGILYAIDASSIAKKAGAPRFKNIVMLGALAASGTLPFNSNILLETILETLPKEYGEINKMLFEEGMEIFHQKGRI